ncbi:unnamed protein product [Peniophora sp. CBMAI 1063]|nr:unnamed protein product [Peniophora sp. CBMAI 1063]
MSARQLLEIRHRGSILSAAFGRDFALQHALDHATHTWIAERATSSDGWGTLEDFIQASYLDLNERDHIPRGLPANSIPFFSWGIVAFDAYTFQARSRSWWYLLDMIAPDPTRIVPSSLFVPYAGTSATRSESVVQGFKRKALWFVRRDGGLGVPAEGSRPLLWHGEKEFQRSPWRKTMKIKFNWPGYDGWWEKQIRMDAGDRSIGRLASLVANKVRDFIYDHDPSVTHSVGTQARWRIGSQAGRISASDILVLGILLVSDGAVMPILQVRDNFVFYA